MQFGPNKCNSQPLSGWVFVLIEERSDLTLTLTPALQPTNQTNSQPNNINQVKPSNIIIKNIKPPINVKNL